MGGRNKALVPLAGTPLVQRALDRLGPQVGKLAVNANRDADDIATLGVPVLTDVYPGSAGPLAGVLTAMQWAEQNGASHVVTVAVDTPFFPTDLVERLTQRGQGMDVPFVLAATSGPRLQPTFGLWPVALRGDLGGALKAGTRKLSLWAQHMGAVSEEFEPPDAFFNINTADDLQTAEAMLAQDITDAC
jgi:molybdopterin-guanine dinucleotide biosynthesis protein A